LTVPLTPPTVAVIVAGPAETPWQHTNARVSTLEFLFDERSHQQRLY
jgi:hypothetical protein